MNRLKTVPSLYQAHSWWTGHWWFNQGLQSISIAVLQTQGPPIMYHIHTDGYFIRHTNVGAHLLSGNDILIHSDSFHLFFPLSLILSWLFLLSFLAFQCPCFLHPFIYFSVCCLSPFFPSFSSCQRQYKFESQNPFSAWWWRRRGGRGGGGEGGEN